MIALDQVTKTYPGDVKALKGISLQIKKGEFVFVVGQSGSGKTTLFKLLLKEMDQHPAPFISITRILDDSAGEEYRSCVEGLVSYSRTSVF